MPGSSVQTYRAAILGQTETGKSTLLSALLLSLPETWTFDPNRNHAWTGFAEDRLFWPDLRKQRGGKGRYHDDGQRLAATAATVGGMTVVFEEANMLIRPGYVSPPAIEDLLHEGRHLPAPDHPRAGVGCILVSRDPVELPQHWLSQVQHTFCFRLQGANNLARIAREGFPPDQVAALPKGQFFHRDAARGGAVHQHAHLFTACDAKE